MEKVLYNSIDKKQNELKYSKDDKSSMHPPPISYNNKYIIWYTQILSNK